MSFRVKKAYVKKEAFMLGGALGTARAAKALGSTGRAAAGGYTSQRGKGLFGSIGKHLSGQGPLGQMAPIMGGMALQSIDNPVAQMGGQLMMMKGMMGGPATGSKKRPSRMAVGRADRQAKWKADAAAKIPPGDPYLNSANAAAFRNTSTPSDDAWMGG